MNRLLPALLLALLSGCVVNEVAAGVGANRTSPWFETGPLLKPREEIVRTVRDQVVRCDYKISEASSSAEKIESDWVVSMSPRYRESFRTRVEVEIIPVERGAFNVRTRSWMEVNNNSNHPSEEDRAIWVGAGVSDRHKDRIEEPAVRLHNMIKVRLVGLNQ